MADNYIDQERSPDVVTKFQDGPRLAARGEATDHCICLICSEPFNAGVNLWEHAKQAHPDSPEVTESAKRVHAKQDFLSKAYVKF